MNIHIREFVPVLAEYQAIAAIHQAIWGEDGLTGENRQQHDARRSPDFLFRRLVVAVDGQIAGHAAYGEDAWNHQPGKYFVEIEIHPNFQRHGLGSACYERILTLLAGRVPVPVHLTAATREDQLGGVAWLQKQGYVQVMRHPAARLNVRSFDASRFAKWQERAKRAGVSLHSMSELMRHDPDWRRHWYDLEMAINEDHPMPDRGEPLPFATFAGFLDTPLVNKDAAFFALDGGRYVGQSTLEVPETPSKRLSVGMTGVLRSHRRLGIATALKVRTIEFAKAYGAHWIETSNEENNPMYQLNLMLGFEPGPAWLDFERRL